MPDDRRIVLVRSTAAGLALIDEAELVKSEIIVSAISRLDPAQLDRLALASTDLGAAIADALADNPGYNALAQCSHAHGPALGSTTRPSAHRICTDRQRPRHSRATRSTSRPRSRPARSRVTSLP